MVPATPRYRGVIACVSWNPGFPGRATQCAGAHGYSGQAESGGDSSADSRGDSFRTRLDREDRRLHGGRAASLHSRRGWDVARSGRCADRRRRIGLSARDRGARFGPRRHAAQDRRHPSAAGAKREDLTAAGSVGAFYATVERGNPRADSTRERARPPGRPPRT